jgi:L-aspartate oxidase
MPTLPTKEEIQDIMMRCVGIVRTETDLLYAKAWFEQYMTSDGFSTLPYESLTNEQVTLFNMLTVSWLVTLAALQRTESIGGHFRSDFPETETMKPLMLQLT